MVWALMLKMCLYFGTSQALLQLPFEHRTAPAPSRYSVAYQGWPARIPCSAATEVEIVDFIDLSESSGDSGDFLDATSTEGAWRYECVIVNENGSVVFNQTTTLQADLAYFTPDLLGGSSINYQLYFINYISLRYIILDFQLHVITPRESTCQDFENQTEDRPLYKEASKATFALHCNTEYLRHNVISQMEFRWFYFCSSKLPANAEGKFNTLQFEALNFGNSGVYVCALMYKGRTRFLSKYNLCVTNQRKAEKLSLECETKTLRKSIGDRAELSCTAGYTQGTPKNFRIQLYKPRHHHPILCVPKFRGEELYSKGEKLSCVYEIAGQHPQCVAPRNPASAALVHVLITINKTGEVDYGKYMINSQGNILSEGIDSINVTFTLEPDLVPALLNEAAVIGTCIAIVLFSLLVMIFLFRNIVFIKVYYKRYFGAYLIEDKKYGALLSYNFSQDLDKFTRFHVQSSVAVVRDFLESKRYRVHDEQKDAVNVGYRRENMANAIEMSHRIVIFLSVDFIKNDWTMLALQKGFQEMINSRSRLIFILLPGIKEYLKQHSKDDDSCRLIQRAIKLNYAIDFPNNLNKRFQFQLEDAMPKIPTSCSSEVSSISSSFDFEISKPHYYQRCFSSETNITIVDISGKDIPTGPFDIVSSIC